MPHYYFHTRIGDETIADANGVQLRDADHAWQVARSMARALLREEGEQAALLSAVVEVRDAQGEMVLEFPFAEALTIPSSDPKVRH